MTQDSGPGEIDLHGLYVKEAIACTDRAIQDAKQRGEVELHLIVGLWILVFLMLPDLQASFRERLAFQRRLSEN